MRPRAYVEENADGIFELWFGEWVLLGSDSQEFVENLAEAMNP